MLKSEMGGMFAKTVKAEIMNIIVEFFFLVCFLFLFFFLFSLLLDMVMI